MILNCERELVDYLKDSKNWDIHFKNLNLIDFDFPVFGCISRKKIGIADIFLQKGRGQKYFVEVKFDHKNPSGDFFYSLKVVGYAKSQNMYNFNLDIKPAIMIRKDILKYDYRAILGALDISWIVFGFDANKNIYFEQNLL